MSEPFDPMHVTYQAADLDADGVVDTEMADYTNDGVADVVLSDVTGDGIADVGVLDTNGDAVADVIGVDNGVDGVADVIAVDTDFDGNLDTVVGDAPVPDVFAVQDGGTDAGMSGAAATDVSTATPDLSQSMSGDTLAVANMVNSSMADASTIYNDAMDPGSESSEDVAAAIERSDNAAANTGAMQGYIHQQEVSNDIAEHDMVQQTLEDGRRVEMDGWRALNGLDA